MTIKNKQLLRDAVNFAKRSAAGEDILVNGAPSRWDQTVYASTLNPDAPEPTIHSCGTAYCIAGYIVAQHPDYEVSLRSTSWGASCLQERIDGVFVNNHESIACSMLGVEEDSDDEELLYSLFSGGNDINDVEYIASQLLGEDI